MHLMLGSTFLSNLRLHCCQTFLVIIVKKFLNLRSNFFLIFEYAPFFYIHEKSWKKIIWNRIIVFSYIVVSIRNVAMQFSSRKIKWKINKRKFPIGSKCTYVFELEGGLIWRKLIVFHHLLSSIFHCLNLDKPFFILYKALNF